MIAKILLLRLTNFKLDNFCLKPTENLFSSSTKPRMEIRVCLNGTTTLKSLIRGCTCYCLCRGLKSIIPSRRERRAGMSRPGGLNNWLTLDYFVLACLPKSVKWRSVQHMPSGVFFTYRQPSRPIFYLKLKSKPSNPPGKCFSHLKLNRYHKFWY